MFLSKFLAAAAAVQVVNALSSTLQHVTGFSSSPTNAQMYVYIPKNKATKPAVVVAIHHCAGSGPGYFNENPGYAQNADTKGE